MADGGEDAIMKHMKALVPTHCADSGVTWAGFILTMRAASRVTIMCFDAADLDLVDDLCDDEVPLLELTTMLYPVLASAAAASSSESAAEKVLVSTVTLTEDEKSVYPGIFSELAGGADTASVTQVHEKIGKSSSSMSKTNMEKCATLAYKFVGVAEGSPLDLNLFVLLMRLLSLTQLSYPLEKLRSAEIGAASLKDGMEYPLFQFS